MWPRKIRPEISGGPCRLTTGSPSAFPRSRLLKSEAPRTSDPEHPANCPSDEEIRAHATLGDGKITINTSKPGHPLWIKVSYHPDWRITEGAGELYPVSPAFMLLVPQTSRVVLTFDTGAGIYLWGKILSLFTILVLILKTLFARTINLPPFSAWWPGMISETPQASYRQRPRTDRIPALPARKNRNKRKVFLRIGPTGRHYPGSNIDEGSS